MEPRAARSTTVILENKTSSKLELDTSNIGLEHGEWSNGFYPPTSIQNHNIGVWQSESDGFMTGTEGYVVYKIIDGETTAGGENKNWVKVHWNNPFAGGNSYSQSVSDGQKYDITRDPNTGDGNNTTVKFILSVK